MIKPIIVVAISLSVLVAALFFKGESGKGQQEATQLLRASMVQMQNAQQDMQRVESDGTNPLLAVLGEDISALQIRIAEALANIRIDGEPVTVTFKQSVLDTSLDIANSQMIADAASYPVEVLRVDLQATLSHTPYLLRFLKSVRLAATGWPSDVRACAIDRINKQALNIHCVLDIYHWMPDSSKFKN